MLLLLSAFAVANTWPEGATLSNAAALYLTEQGLNQAGAFVPALVPSEPMEIPPMSEDGGFYSFSFQDGWVAFEVRSTQVTPKEGFLQVAMVGTAWVNDETDRFLLEYDALLSDECPGYVLPFDWVANAPVTLSVDSAGQVQATFGTVDMVLDIQNSHIQLDCNITAIEAVLDAFGYSLYGFFIDMAQQEMQAQIQEQIPDLEATLEEALNSARYDGELALGDAVIHLKIDPEEIKVTPAGMEYVFSGLAESDTHHECIAEWDTHASLGTESARPAMSEVPADTDLGVLVSDDFANQVFYGVWTSGLLCYELASGDPNSPVPVDGAMAALLTGDEIGAVIRKDGPALIRTVPSTQPVARYDLGHDVDMVIDPFGLDIFAEVDYRMARPLGVNLRVDAGADLRLNGTTGELALDVILDANSITTTVVHNEFAPSATSQIEADFSATVLGLIQPLMGSLLSDFATTLPSVQGLGLTDLSASAAGSGGDWLGVWGSLGPVAYSGEAGCEGGSCAALGPASLAWSALFGALALRRRRR